MIKYCLDKWNKNHKRLEEALIKDRTLNCCDYAHLVELVVNNILNDEEGGYRNTWNASKITVIDNGDYQGTLLFLIPKNRYQPGENEYLMTYANYGSCSVCDALMGAQCGGDAQQQLKDFMLLCKDLVTNMIKPYNCGWREESEFEEVKMDEEE